MHGEIGSAEILHFRKEAEIRLSGKPGGKLIKLRPFQNGKQRHCEARRRHYQCDAEKPGILTGEDPVKTILSPAGKHTPKILPAAYKLPQRQSLSEIL